MTVYDPFCGSGVVLQEALIEDYEVWGSDISEKMVRASVENT
jgi:tRNA G10  N-methylase Trm11